MREPLRKRRGLPFGLLTVMASVLRFTGTWSQHESTSASKVAESRRCLSPERVTADLIGPPMRSTVIGMTDSIETIAQRITAALNARDMSAFRSLIAQDAKWGDSDLPDGRACFNRNDIITTYKRLLDQGVRGTVVETITGPAGVACHVVIEWPNNLPNPRNDLYQVFLVRDGVITRIEGMDERDLAVARIRP
jgi:hypothetical protein